MCLSMLRMGSVAVGANKANDPLPHYNGNFWWIKSDFSMPAKELARLVLMLISNGHLTVMGVIIDRED